MGVVHQVPPGTEWVQQLAHDRRVAFGRADDGYAGLVEPAFGHVQCIVDIQSMLENRGFRAET